MTFGFFGFWKIDSASRYTFYAQEYAQQYVQQYAKICFKNIDRQRDIALNIAPLCITKYSNVYTVLVWVPSPSHSFVFSSLVCN